MAEKAECTGGTEKGIPWPEIQQKYERSVNVCITLMMGWHVLVRYDANSEWIAKTAWSNDRYGEKVKKLMEEAKKLYVGQ